MHCTKCNSKLYIKNDSIFRSLLLGTLGVKAFPKYYCNNCGALNFTELPDELKKKAYGWRIVYLLGAIVAIYILFLI